MKNLFSDSISDATKETFGYLEVENLPADLRSASELESMIEKGILQDYMDVMGKMEEN
mgnify:FL=1|jgi:hypothetical protein